MTNSKIKHKYPFFYKGNKLLLILFLIIWFPVGLILLLKNGRFIRQSKAYYLHYKGRYVWLFLWLVFFFPIAIFLIILNGVDLIEELDEDELRHFLKNA